MIGMDTAELIVLVFALTSIALTVWYFFLSEGRAEKAGVDSSGTQLVKITVQGGYSPNLIEVAANRGVDLDFFRNESDSCSDTVVFSELGVSQPLAPFKSTHVKFGPLKPGRYSFHCSMDMIRGVLVVKDE